MTVTKQANPWHGCGGCAPLHGWRLYFIWLSSRFGVLASLAHWDAVTPLHAHSDSLEEAFMTEEMYRVTSIKDFLPVCI